MDTNDTTTGVFAGAWSAEREIDLPVAAVLELREQPAAEGERRLLTVLLKDAVRCYRKHAFSGTRRGRRLFGEAEAWFMNPDLEVAVPFQYVCDVLGMSAERLRSSLERWRAEHFTGAAVFAAAARPYRRQAGPLQRGGGLRAVPGGR